MPHFCFPAPPPTFLGGGGAFPFTRAFTGVGNERKVVAAPMIVVWRKERRSAFNLVVVWSVRLCRLVRILLLLLCLFVDEKAATTEEGKCR